MSILVLLVLRAFVSPPPTVAIAGQHDGRAERPATSRSAETAIASVKLGVSAAPPLLCSTDEPSDTETVLEFRTKDVGAGGAVFLVVRTSCPKTKCNGQEERTIIGVAITSIPELKSQCPLPAGISLATSRGLRLGASVATVLRLYGEPSERHPRKGSPNNFHYAGRLGKGVPTEFMVEFTAGRVTSLALFVNEDEH